MATGSSGRPPLRSRKQVESGKSFVISEAFERIQIKKSLTEDEKV